MILGAESPLRTKNGQNSSKNLHPKKTNTGEMGKNLGEMVKNLQISSPKNYYQYWLNVENFHIFS